MAGLQGWQLVIIILLAILLFAAPKLPAMARNLGPVSYTHLTLPTNREV